MPAPPAPTLPPRLLPVSSSAPQSNARAVCDKLKGIPGLNPVMPRGAMYLMVGVDPAKFKDITSDVDFTQKLLKEQSVFCLPATVFDLPNFFRIVTSVPKVRAWPCHVASDEAKWEGAEPTMKRRK